MDSRSCASGPIFTLMTCCATHMYRVEHSCWPSLCLCSAPSLDPVCSTLCSNCFCSNCHNCLLARHVILHDFLWHVQCMVHGLQALGRFNPLFFEPVRTSPHPAIWLRKVGLLSSQSEPWVDATWPIEIEHPGCAENQALSNHRCSAEHVLLHALVKYTIQLALQHKFVYTQYNHVFWALRSVISWDCLGGCLTLLLTRLSSMAVQNGCICIQQAAVFHNVKRQWLSTFLRTVVYRCCRRQLKR